MFHMSLSFFSTNSTTQNLTFFKSSFQKFLKQAGRGLVMRVCEFLMKYPVLKAFFEIDLEDASRNQIFCLTISRERWQPGHYRTFFAYFCTSGCGSGQQHFQHWESFSSALTIQKSFLLQVYSFSDEALKAFIAESVMSHVIRDRGSMFDANRFRTHLMKYDSLSTVAQLCQRGWNESASILWILERRMQTILFSLY